MARSQTYDICRVDLFTPKEELQLKYAPTVVQRIIRVRQAYLGMVEDPGISDKEIVNNLQQAYRISETTAYSDLQVVKKLLPALSEATRDFHLWRSNEMLLETFRVAKSKGNVQAMERAASSYAKINRVDVPADLLPSYEEITIQPFTATSDPTVLGIEPIPNIRVRVKELIDRYSKDFAEIADVEYEEIDLEENKLFGDIELPTDE